MRVACRYILQASFHFFKITLTPTYSNKLPILHELTDLSILSAEASVGADGFIKNTKCIVFQLKQVK